MFVRFSLESPAPTLYQVAPRLYFGNLAGGCTSRSIADAAIVHACKDPCHKCAVGYGHRIETTHPHYLALERGQHLYLNMIDPPLPLFRLAMFHRFLDFAQRQMAERALIIHCNQGMSRAPSLALLIMAKQLALLPNSNYESAKHAFSQQFPYTPGKGIAIFLTEHWNTI